MPLIGREQEQQTIVDALQGLSSGRGALLLICGEAGIGKSSLARWTVRRAEQSRVDAHWGICWEAGGAPAYWPWSQLLRSLLDTKAAGINQLRSSPALFQLVPELAEGGSTIALSQADQARFQLLEAMRGLLQRASDAQPLLLTLEDLHAADTDTLLLLQFLAPHLENLPILVLGTFRDADARLAGSDGPLWQAARGAEVLHLDGLADTQIGDLLKEMTGEEATPEQRRQLLQRTDGNPFFLTELIQLSASSKAMTLPDSIQQLIHQHLGRLPADTLALLETGAVIGREFGARDLSAICNHTDLEAALAPAIKLEIIQRVEAGQLRFSHIIYRDVIYAAMERDRSRDLHLRYARHLRQLIDGGQNHRWQELALHFERSGRTEQDTRTESWRQAGLHAKSMAAFEDAASCLQKALALFGEEPGADPVRHCELLLDLAEVEMARGDIDSAHDHCRRAFTIACSLEDASLMASSALVFGSAYVATNIDDELVAMLEAARGALPDSASAERAQVMARLAAALQPAEDPSGPIETARDAIALARKCNDEEVLLRTLRSAISALMDFAPADERYELNREYIALAAKAHRPTEQFRGHLRLLIDCMELGRGGSFEAAIAACDTLANDLALPHYQWWVASALTMRDLIRGDYSGAEQHHQRARELAERSEDRGADIPLALQQLQLTENSPSITPARAEAAVGAVEDVLADYPWAELFLRPALFNFRRRHGLAIPASSEVDEAAIAQLLRWNDRMSLIDLAEVALHREDIELCREIYQALLPYSDQCAHLGLMGMGWAGPVAISLARCAHFLGRHHDAITHLGQARTLAEQMDAGPTLATIRELVQTLQKSDATQTQLETAAPRVDGGLSLERHGEMWQLEFAGKSCLMKDSKGLQLLFRLMASPDLEIHVLDLMGARTAGGPGESGDDPILDEQARRAYKQRLSELQEEMDDAAEMGDIGRSEQALQEMEFIRQELARAFGLGGRSRKSGSDAERARVNVQRRLKDAIKKIAEQMPAAGRYLQGTIDTGTYCRYRPL